MSPKIAKPCPGYFDDDTEQLLILDVDRARWKQHLCITCGNSFSPRFEKHRWVPDQHWPSISFLPKPGKQKVPKKSPRYSRVTGEVLP